MDSILFQSATEMAKDIRSGKETAVSLVTKHLDHIANINPHLNAIVQLTADTALAQAAEQDEEQKNGTLRGPLHGVPFTVKDNLETVAISATSGTLGRANNSPVKDAELVRRMRQAGGIMLGKTNMPELGLAYETDNLVYGQTNNPYNLDYSPGGSSGGEGAIIAAGGSPIGLGNDFGGSIRIPAHFCGIAGLKPTTGRLPKTGGFPPAGGALASFMQHGPMARYVSDLWLAFSILAGPDGADPHTVPVPLVDPQTVDLSKIKVAFYTDNGIIPADPEVAKTVHQTADLLANAGLQIIEKTPPALSQTADLFSKLIMSDGGISTQNLLHKVGTKETHPLLTQIQEQRMAHGENSASQLMSLLYQLDQFRKDMLFFMNNYDLILSPVSSYAALPHKSTLEKGGMLGFSYSIAFNMCGWPATVVRAGTTSTQLPIGVQLVAPPWEEASSLAVATIVEQSFGYQPPTLNFLSTNSS